MKKDFHQLDLVSLLDLYNTEVDSLNQRLLSGEPWDALAEQRNTVTRLAAIIHKKEPHLNLLQMKMPGQEVGNEDVGTGKDLSA